MRKITILGATGRSGSKIFQELLKYEDIQITVALRKESDASRLPVSDKLIRTVVVDIFNLDSLKIALQDVDVLINAIRLREDILADELVLLDKRMRKVIQKDCLIVTIGGAGTLQMENGSLFWESSNFPTKTLPRGRANAKLRDYLLQLPLESHWTYLIPPPAFDPDGARLGTYQKWEPGAFEQEFLKKKISYADFALAVSDAAYSEWSGIYLIGYE